ncbi:hypothetical protein BZARG_2738 [Bizionia argentinensis JUB59]|uniref:DUF4304 domain-containing protein n=1 Tax=Bizionia argentinensis JUB59 TaxID=1046627 RepID=G2EAR1_9FLAO|nr:hypothetical protein [Bizionia argentinensis]EGV44476.1 hypothetical protein BZARG_2738 [Bizionia argentinensis JUB59]
MEITKKSLEGLILGKINQKYNVRYGDTDYLIYSFQDKFYSVEFRFRIQYKRLVTFEGFSIFSSKEIEKEISNLILEDLKNYYDDDFYFNSKKFYKTDYDFSQEIISETHLEEFLNEFVKCLEYHEQEVFPKLLDINFLAEYVGSVPFDQQAEIPVGGNFPVHLFKKLAVLKWGNQEERYLEYKINTNKLIESYSIKKPQKYKPSFETGFKNLINQLENEPNPFEHNNIC